MAKYYCPYCSPRYQIHKSANGLMICGHCGEELVKVPYIRPTQIIALVAATAFIAPIIAMIFAFLLDVKRPENDSSLHKNTLVSCTTIDISQRA